MKSGEESSDDDECICFCSCLTGAEHDAKMDNRRKCENITNRLHIEEGDMITFDESDGTVVTQELMWNYRWLLMVEERYKKKKALYDGCLSISWTETTTNGKAPLSVPMKGHKWVLFKTTMTTPKIYHWKQETEGRQTRGKRKQQA